MYGLARIRSVTAGPRNLSLTVCRSFHSSHFVEDDAAAAATATNPDDDKKKEIQFLQRLAARDYNNRRAVYKRQVTKLRYDYAQMIAKQRAADEKEADARQQEITRRRLERQRLKNIRTANIAMREKELREQREREFNEHLRMQQMIRDNTNDLFTAARQLVVDELEEEAPLWLTTREEVDNAFTHEAQQLLWSRPGGIFGAPNPSVDSHFWQYETHTKQISPSYTLRREYLLDLLQRQAYNEANIDKKFWTKDRLKEQQEREDRARLRAMVHSAGRSQLLKLQMELLEENFEDKSEGDVPKSRPIPSLDLLNDDKALEKEGVRLLLNDPTRFFKFDSKAYGNNTNNELSYEGPALGFPVGLVDPLRGGNATVFPEVIGKLPKADTRSEREKKQQEREERLLEAALAQEKAQEEVDMDVVDDFDIDEDVDYDNEIDSDDEEWEKGLDPEIDARLLNVPRQRRFTEEDIQWALEKLETSLKLNENLFAASVERNKSIGTSDDSASDGNGNLEALILALPQRQMLALSDLDDKYVDGVSDDEIDKALADIPNLTKEQVMLILTRDRTE